MARETNQNAQREATLIKGNKGERDSTLGGGRSKMGPGGEGSGNPSHGYTGSRGGMGESHGNT